MLQVAMGGEVISSSVVFEYKARDLPALPSSQHDWLSLDGERICISRAESSRRGVKAPADLCPTQRMSEHVLILALEGLLR